jgi:hypothetical protein
LTVLGCASISAEVNITTFVDLVVLFVDGPPGMVGEAFREDGVLEPKLMLRILPVPGSLDIFVLFLSFYVLLIGMLDGDWASC